MDTTHCPYCFSFTPKIPCSNCGWQTSQDNPPPALPLGQVLDGRYRIGRVLGHGGFGITYLAWDDNLQLRLAIKEYLPRDCASRAADGVSLAIYAGQAREQFNYGLDRFLEEARALAHFDQHPGIVTVKNFFRAHGTGYCVMDYVEGITLSEYLGQQPDGRISFEAALKLLMPVMDALRAVHKEGLLHRDIAPDNIYLTQDGRIKLLDFGAARYAASEHSKSLSIILKPGYAPEEQYRTKGRQGPWTDVYGLGATLYRTITGLVPPEALDRLDHDELLSPKVLGVAIKPKQEALLLKALAVKAEQRFQDIASFQQECKSENVIQPQLVVFRQETVSESGAPKPQAPDPKQLAHAPPSKSGKGKKLAFHIAIITGLILFVVKVIPILENNEIGRSDLMISAAQEEVDAAFNEGWAALERSDYQQGLAIFRPLAESGNADGQTILGVMYRDGLGVNEDAVKAVLWFSKAAEQGHEYGQNNLGLMYREGHGVFKDYIKAVYWFRKAAEQGNAEGQYHLGFMYEEGLGVEKDDAEAAIWYRKAAEQGNAEGQFGLGLMYAEGRGVAEDDAEAVLWFRKAAEQDHPLGQTSLGLMYALGSGVAEDDAEAVRWFRKAAEQGNAQGQYHLGFMYAEGRGVRKDNAEAVRWYRLAAEQGDADALNNLGVMYADGTGIKKDNAKAIKLFRQGADQGNAACQISLGVMYEEGQGVKKDIKEAKRWYRKAAKQGNADAIAALERLDR